MSFFRRDEIAEEELAALADGSLPPERRAAVEERVAASPELAERLEEQRLAVTALRGIDVQAPPALRARVEAQRAARARPSRQRTFALGAGLATAVAAAVALLVVLPWGAGGPTVAEAATLATQPSTAPAPAPLPNDPKLLAADVEGVVFPSWDEEFGWSTSGQRSDRLEGRDTRTVFYTKDGKRIGYTIVSGSALEVPPTARRTRREGVELWVFREGGRNVVTWLRDKKSCVLSGEDVPQPTLVKLAAWNGMGSVSF